MEARAAKDKAKAKAKAKRENVQEERKNARKRVAEPAKVRLEDHGPQAASCCQPYQRLFSTLTVTFECLSHHSPSLKYSFFSLSSTCLPCPLSFFTHLSFPFLLLVLPRPLQKGQRMTTSKASARNYYDDVNVKNRKRKKVAVKSPK